MKVKLIVILILILIIATPVVIYLKPKNTTETAQTLLNQPAVEALKSELYNHIISAGTSAKPEYNNNIFQKDITNFQATNEWATGAIVFMPPANVDGGPDSLLFVAHKQGTVWSIRTEMNDNWAEWYKQSAKYFYNTETIDYINNNY